jgi:hypothetical protein
MGAVKVVWMDFYADPDFVSFRGKDPFETFLRSYRLGSSSLLSANSSTAPSWSGCSRTLTEKCLWRTTLARDSSERGAQGQAFRPQPMGLWLQGRPRQPRGCSFQQSGPGNTCTVLRLRPPGLPLRSELSCSSVKLTFMNIIHLRPEGEARWSEGKWDDSLEWPFDFSQHRPFDFIL